MEIRRVRKCDIISLAEISWQYKMKLKNQDHDSRKKYLDKYCAYMNQKLEQDVVAWIASYKEKNVGAISLHIVALPPHPTNSQRSLAYLSEIEMMDEKNRVEIKRELLKMVVSWSKEANAELIYLWPSEKTARKYRDLGALDIEEITDTELDERFFY